MNQSSIALTPWEAIADLYASRIDTRPRNAHYERPATLSLLPKVEGKRILDAGCGPGIYTEWLVNHGAEVVALDISPKMVEFAAKRVGARAAVLQADISQPLAFLQDESFDTVLSALALDYVQDWSSVFREFFRVLRQPGYFVFSIGHPFADFIQVVELFAGRTGRMGMDKFWSPCPCACLSPSTKGACKNNIRFSQIKQRSGDRLGSADCRETRGASMSTKNKEYNRGAP